MVGIKVVVEAGVGALERGGVEVGVGAKALGGGVATGGTDEASGPLFGESADAYQGHRRRWESHEEDDCGQVHIVDNM
ncbi:hypothetical protein TorRG33x02_016240 [Trema orientale]|uniref:Uncharacterized protein n=1 Tax=Trema orientale TaxID=63057 RepID=A0A2P5FXW6_TREOI|nr:hypothetical protein TorRG33x02_016240 [Trema orientale]